MYPRVKGGGGGETYISQLVGSLPHGGPIQLFCNPTGALILVLQSLWYVISNLGDGAYKRALAVNRERVVHKVAPASFL